MLYRKMPKTGDELSILGFACMPLAEKDGRIDEARAASQIRYATDHVGSYFCLFSASASAVSSASAAAAFTSGPTPVPSQSASENGLIARVSRIAIPK